MTDGLSFFCCRRVWRRGTAGSVPVENGCRNDEASYLVAAETQVRFLTGSRKTI